MDLGFGEANQRVGSLTQQALLQSALRHEQALGQELDKYNAVLNDDEQALTQLRLQRLQQMKQQTEQQARFRAAGHGQYTELLASSQDTRDVARDFFEATKQSERVVVHFYRPSTVACEVFHKHLERLAATHLETRFVKLNVQDCDTVSAKGASFLVQRLGVTVMPTLQLIVSRRTVHQVLGFDELGNTDGFRVAALAKLLVRHKVLWTNADDDGSDNDDDEPSIRGGINTLRVNRGTSRFVDDE
jgi:hypothetical protein